MNTAFILMAQYQTALIPAERVAKDYFSLSTDKFVRKALAGEIPIPLVRMCHTATCRPSTNTADP